MTFIIRQITKRKTGDDIVRDRRFGQDKLTVGRATHNDLFLSDLRVALDHLTISKTGDLVVVEGVQGQTFLVGGKAQRQLTLKPSQAKTISVGPFELSFSINDEGTWVISVTRVDPEVVLREEDVDALFTLRGTALGKRVPAWVFLLVVLAAFLVAPIAWFMGALPQPSVEDREGDPHPTFVDFDASWFSGEMSSGHANLGDQCEACHNKAFEHVTDETCLDCHEDTGDHAEPTRLSQSMGMPGGFDGMITKAATYFGKEPGECADCHREHNGDQGIILQASSLCTDCHIGIDERLPDSAVEEAGDFGDSHPNFDVVLVKEPGAEPLFHRVALGSEAARDNSGLKFPHDLHLDTTGGVARQAQDLSEEFGFGDALVCEDCHAREDDDELFEQISMEDNCQMCHSLAFDTGTGVERTLPHGKPLEVIATMREFYRGRALGSIDTEAARRTIRRRPGSSAEIRENTRSRTVRANSDEFAQEMVEAVFEEGGSCYGCHTILEPVGAEVPYEIVPVNLVDKFMVRARFDHESHETGDLECESCHAAQVSELSSDVLLPQIETTMFGGEEVVGCRDCHDGEKAGPGMVASACLDCHQYHEVTHGVDPEKLAALNAAGHGGQGQLAGNRQAFSPARWRRIPSEAIMQ